MRSLTTMLLVLTLFTTVSADGINKPKKKPKPKPKAAPVKKTPVAVKPVVKPPPLLTTTYHEALAPDLKKLESLLPVPDLPLVTPIPVTTSETFVYPFEEERRLWPWLFLIPVAAIPFLIPREDDDVPIVTPPPGVINPTTVPPPSEIPEPTTLLLLGSGLIGVIGRLRRRK